MSDRQGDYLWDRGGTPDPELERLEALLGRFGQAEPPPMQFTVNVLPRTRPWAAAVALAAAAAIVLPLVGVAWWTARHPAPGFAVTRTAGTPRLGSWL